MFIVENITEQLKNFDGSDLKDSVTGADLTYKNILVAHLGAYGGQGVTGEQVIKSYELGMKINSAKDSVELDSDQMKFIKDVLSKKPLFLALVMGQTFKKLENARDLSKEAKEVEKKDVTA